MQHFTSLTTHIYLTEPTFSAIYIVPDDAETKNFVARVGQHEALAGFEFRFLGNESEFDVIFDEEGESVYAAVMFSSLNESVSGGKGISFGQE